MSTEANKAVVLRYFEETHNKGNLDIMDELCTPHYTEGLKPFLAMEFTAFPDAHFVIEHVAAEGDKVALRATSTGTHLGEWRDWYGFGTIAPTGRRVTVTHTLIYRVDADKIVEEWSDHDILGLYLQLGVIRSPGQATT